MRRLERAERRDVVPAQDRPLLRVTLRIPCGTRRKCEAMLSAIAPDDRQVPEWLAIREHVEDNSLVVEVECRELKPLSIRNTVDEILEYLYSLLKSLEAVGADEESSRSPS